ncbi:MAG: FAD-dependent oxidoreductase [Candidatus Eremiobacteraeota bacterium]|nr:FAD-dependent oxidoreductase [Candidatus Eremiobacteraeota bacterium]
MPIVPNLTPHGRRVRQAAAPNPVYWPYIDSMYDFVNFLTNGQPGTPGPPIASAPSGSSPTIGIVGAGAAGMVAAYELLRAGFNPVVFEATERVGGRNWSQPFDPQNPTTGGIAEMGAMRVPTASETFYYYASTLFNMPTNPFPDPGKVATQIYYQNQLYPWPANQNPPEPFLSLSNDFNTFVGNLTAPIYENWTPDLIANPVWQQYVNDYAGVSFYSALAQGIPTWTDVQLSQFGALGMGSGGFGPLYEVGFLEMLRLLVLGWEVDQQLMLNGINSLTDNLFTAPAQPSTGASLQSLGSVLFGAPVTAIDAGGSQLVVTYTLAGTPTQMVVDALIVATTTRSMEIGMGLTLPSASGANLLTQNVRSALRDLPLMNSSKLFIRTATKFWNDNPNLPQTIQTDELPRGIYCLDYQGVDYGVVLISYTWQDDSSKLLAIPPPQRFQLFVSIIEQINPDFAAQLVPVGGDAGIINVDWEATPYYYGAFKLNYPGQEPDCQAAYYQFLSVLGGSSGPDTGVYLAGDSVSWSGGWTEGALQTGLNAACAAAQHAGGTVRAGSPLTQVPNLYDYSATGSSPP